MANHIRNEIEIRADFLNKWLKENHVTRTEFCEAIGKGENYLRMLKRYGYRVNPKTFDKMIKVMKVMPNKLFKERKQKPVDWRKNQKSEKNLDWLYASDDINYTDSEKEIYDWWRNEFLPAGGFNQFKKRS